MIYAETDVRFDSVTMNLKNQRKYENVFTDSYGRWSFDYDLTHEIIIVVHTRFRTGMKNRTTRQRVCFVYVHELVNSSREFDMHSSHDPYVQLCDGTAVFYRSVAEGPSLRDGTGEKKKY